MFKGSRYIKGKPDILQHERDKRWNLGNSSSLWLRFAAL